MEERVDITKVVTIKTIEPILLYMFSVLPQRVLRDPRYRRQLVPNWS
jgi:hypothetical protein